MRRAAKFAKDNKALEDERSEKQVLKNKLKADVKNLERDLAIPDFVGFVCHPKAEKHRYADPIETFRSAFAAANLNQLSARQGPQGLEITVKLGGDHTVTAGYRGRILTVFHCGEVQGGVSYGIPLGDDD